MHLNGTHLLQLQYQIIYGSDSIKYLNLPMVYLRQSYGVELDGETGLLVITLYQMSELSLWNVQHINLLVFSDTMDQVIKHILIRVLILLFPVQII